MRLVQDSKIVVGCVVVVKVHRSMTEYMCVSEREAR